MTPASEKPIADRDGAVDVSVLVAVRNEEKFIRETAEAMRSQEFAGRLEFLFVDGRSDDATAAIIREMADQDARIHLLDNPRRTVASGLNVGLRHARGRFVVQMEGHTYYPPRYIATAIDRLDKGDVEFVSGTPIPIGVDPWSRRIALALTSWLGTGGSRKWAPERELPEVELDTGVFGGAWRRSTLDAHGGWDESWQVNRDAELASRILEDGGKIVALADLHASYVPRSSLPALARQYFRYGYYRVKTARRHPISLRRSHVLLPALILALVAAVIAPQPVQLAAWIALVAYLAATVVAAARSGAARPSDALALPLVYATMHLSWGLGFLAGCVRFGPPLRALGRLVRHR